jgi:hypothetical protein
MRRGKTQVLGNISADTWEKIYETTLTEAATSLTISNLDGNTDEEYRLIIRGIGGHASGWQSFRVRPNNDDTADNYGVQQIRGASSTASAYRGTDRGFYGGGLSPSQAGLADFIIYAKSGYVRTCILSGMSINAAGGTTIEEIRSMGQSWNNTADNVTSFTIVGVSANEFGVGTQIELYRKSKKV